MPKFKFKLQALLNLKLQQEDNLKNEMGKANQRLEMEKAVLRQLEEYKEECIKELQESFEYKITVDKIKKYNIYISSIIDKIRLQKDNVNNARIYVDRVRDELVKILKERQILEKLKDRKYECYLREQAGIEQKLNDEIAGYRYTKKGTED